MTTATEGVPRSINNETVGLTTAFLGVLRRKSLSYLTPLLFPNFSVPF